MACGVFGGLMTKYYIRVGLLSGDNETSWKPAQPLMAGPLCVKALLFFPNAPKF